MKDWKELEWEDWNPKTSQQKKAIWKNLFESKELKGLKLTKMLKQVYLELLAEFPRLPVPKPHFDLHDLEAFKELSLVWETGKGDSFCSGWIIVTVPKESKHHFFVGVFSSHLIYEKEVSTFNAFKKVISTPGKQKEIGTIYSQYKVKSDE